MVDKARVVRSIVISAVCFPKGRTGDAILMMTAETTRTFPLHPRTVTVPKADCG